MPIILPEKFFHNVYDILEEHVQASPWQRDEFINYFINNKGDSFYFCGSLGSGEAFNNQGGRIYLTCNSEDETDEVYETLEKVNEILEEMLIDYIANLRKKRKKDE